MFEAYVLHLLRRYLGEYVHGLSVEALRISVWQGDVVLKDLKLKAEALNSLKLPVTVKAGFIGTITLKVPWKSLGKEPVIVLIDRVFILAYPLTDGQNLKEDREKLFEAKLQQIEETEAATLEAMSKSKLGSPPPGNSWLGSLIATIIGNLKISISNVHVRYEDSTSNPGHPFCSGVTLAKLAAVTMDEQGNETFDTSGALDKLRKSLQLERLAMYHDSGSVPWKIDKGWEDLTPEEWIQIFEDGINEPAAAANRKYLVSPINGVLKYHRIGDQERNDSEVPFEKASFVLSDVSLTVIEAQYYDWIKLLEVVSRYKTYVVVSHLRPVVPVSEGPYLWWHYAAKASLQQKKMCYRFSWDRIRDLCQLRRRYIQLYAGSLQHLSNVKNAEIREIERDLDPKVILLWRLLAHAKVESVKTKEAAEQRSFQNQSWFSFMWRTPAEDSAIVDASKGSQLVEERLTKEEWQAIHKLLSYQPEESHSGKDVQNMIRFLVTVSVGQAAARIIDINQTEVVCCRFEQLQVSTKFKNRSTYCDVSLKFYGLSAPEGSLAQSVCSEQKVNALAASFVHCPVGENVDWRLSATISPCHVTVLMESFHRFLEFVKRSNAVSPTVTLETATALQMKIEQVTRRAQEQFQMVLEEQSRFALDIDLDAPKVRVPIRTCGSSKCDSHFLLDFGHFTLHTKDSQHDEQRQNLYSRFFITGRDIAAFFVDCGSDRQSCTLDVPDYDNHLLLSPSPDNVENCYSLIDRCGMAVLVDQIIVPHPSYPSMRISIQVPNLGIHFSPSRFQRLMKLLYIFNGTLETCNASQPALDDFQAETPWSLSDLSTEARILAWRGIGNSVATWQLCYLVLSGINLYVLESEKSQSHQRHTSMAGRQVYEVPPANIGGSLFCVAVSYRGMENQKALESPTTLIIEFRAEHEKAIWLKGLIQATYQASAPPSVNVLGETSNPDTDYGETQTMNSKTADLVINGALVETKIFIYGKTGDKVDEECCETLILEVLANGGKLHMIRWEGDLTLKMKLHSLKIKDELQVRLSTTPQYLACSVLNNDNLVSSPGIVDPHMKEMSALLHEDDDTFTDALPDFMSISDTGLGSQIMDMDTCATTEDVNDDTGFATPQAIIHEKKLVKEKVISGEIFYEADGGDNSNFVSVTFLTRSSSSPDYDGIDTQMNLRMSKLEFFCNRPTLVALIDFGLDLSCVYDVEGSADITKVPDDKPLMNKEKNEESIKGLLGYGKGRVVFYLNMNVDNVTVFLNKEDGSSFAMFVQESFLLDLKVHPSSLSIEGTLGNFRLHDMSLGTDHCWAWLCDIRNPGVESLIKFKFNSYSAEDDDYEGYDYSLCGRLSAVRIIFLYRFVQEITEYFMELATPDTEEAIKLVDKVGGFEWLIQKYEIDGATALKLDLSLDTPIIIVPRNSTSKDFIQLDLGQLKVTNEFSWYGSPEKDPSAVHIDVLHAEILGISMSVGIDGCLGKSMIREGKGLDVYVRRSLRDVFKKVPTFALEVKVGLLHGVMSDKEYKVILDCAYMNLCEEPKLPPSFRGGKSGSMDTMRLLADKVNMNSQLLLSKTVTIVAVVIDNALLELYNGIHAESPFAQIAIEGLWVTYRMTSLSETDLYITIPKFSVVDIRPDTKPEMRLMLGSSADDSKQVSFGSLPLSLNTGSFRKKDSDAEFSHVDLPISTMFLMDYRWRKSSQSFVVRVQQPRVLVVADFLLAVGEFFVPALRTITGREEVMDPTNDLIGKSCSIVFSGPIYKQIEDVVHLSPSRQLVADCLHIDEYTYDGCGKTIHLSEETDTKYLHSTRPHPIIIIGCGKKLRFMNVKIENGSILRKYTHLSNDSSYSLSFEDGVDITLLDSYSSDEDKKSLEDSHKSSDTTNISSDSESDPNMIPSFSFEAQVVSPEFTFYDSSKSCLDDSYGEKLLRAKLDFSFMYASKENDTWVRALVKDLTVEAGSGLIVLDPVDISGGYTSVKDKTNMSLLSTDVCFHLSLSVVSLILNLQTQATSALQFGNSLPLVGCTNFDRIWVSPKENGSCYNLTFWRPRAPSNYVILGDCVTSRPVPPSQAVMAVSNAYGRVRQPIGFNLIGLFSTIQGFGGGDSDVGSDCSLWMPIAPPGYIALGCLANIGKEQPPNHIVYCLRSDLVTSTTYSECLFSSPSNPHFASAFSIWRVENVLGSFHAHSSTECPSKDNCCNLNHLLLWNWNRQQSSPKESASNLAVDIKYASHQTRNQTGNSSRWDIVRSISKANNCFMSTPNFERIWWDKGSDLRRPVSIWRPIARCGYAILGDCITEGLEPPAVGIMFKADDPEVSAKPVQFTKVAHVVGKGFDEVFFWYPLAPPGYASLGCIVSRTGEAPCVDTICCPRMDFVNQANILEAPISRSSTSKGSQCWSVWRVENQASTFLARADLKKPSSRLAYAIGDSLKPKTRENITAEVKLRCFSLTVLDSLCGMMKPLFDTTITNIKCQGVISPQNSCSSMEKATRSNMSPISLKLATMLGQGNYLSTVRAFAELEQKTYPNDEGLKLQPHECATCCATHDTINFTDEDLLLGSKPHNRPLFVSGYVREYKVNRMLVDGGSAINIMPKSTMTIIGIKVNELSLSQGPNAPIFRYIPMSRRKNGQSPFETETRKADTQWHTDNVKLLKTNAVLPLTQLGGAKVARLPQGFIKALPKKLIPQIEVEIDKLIEAGFIREKDVPFVWDKACHNAFESIKKYLSSPPVLGAPVPGKPLILYIAAQENSIGALLAQENESQKEGALYYLSRTLTGAELNYSPIEKMCLALVFAIQKLRHYMHAYTIHLVAKADPVKYVMSKPVLTGRLAKWALLLNQYEIIYVSAKAVKGQALADFLADHPIPADWKISDDLPDEEMILDIVPKYVDEHLASFTTKEHSTDALLKEEVKKETVVRFIKEHIIHRYGVPRYIITDNGKQFSNRLVDELCDKYKFKQHKSSMYHAPANGLAEAFNKTLCNLLKKVIGRTKRDWHERISEALWAYRTTHRTPTRATPYSLVYGVEAKMQSCAFRSWKRWMREGSKLNNTWNATKHDLVLALRRPIITTHKTKSKFTSKWDGPYVIQEIYTNGAYLIMAEDGTVAPTSCSLRHQFQIHKKLPPIVNMGNPSKGSKEICECSKTSGLQTRRLTLCLKIWLFLHLHLSNKEREKWSLHKGCSREAPLLGQTPGAGSTEDRSFEAPILGGTLDDAGKILLSFGVRRFLATIVAVVASCITESSPFKIKPRWPLKKSQVRFKIKCSPPLNQIQLQIKGVSSDLRRRPKESSSPKVFIIHQLFILRSSPDGPLDQQFIHKRTPFEDRIRGLNYKEIVTPKSLIQNIYFIIGMNKTSHFSQLHLITRKRIISNFNPASTQRNIFKNQPIRICISSHFPVHRTSGPFSLACPPSNQQCWACSKGAEGGSRVAAVLEAIHKLFDKYSLDVQMNNYPSVGSDLDRYLGEAVVPWKC
ncbi:hypothetical protein D8674_009527 [Pyrus ussuriensis x Pyrus communis]|uniref:Integrase catalytic domain-containing protein n=1 Tax=Pyrus ussuriensis x Pyrus communis TaxID=2448454 RepID=A0A5N5F874_9ROSA|nr:hypothetical protein D8674_009527 [Pyrus ussuriensis x Pyrus communis]